MNFIYIIMIVMDANDIIKIQLAGIINYKNRQETIKYNTNNQLILQSDNDINEDLENTIKPYMMHFNNDLFSNQLNNFWTFINDNSYKQYKDAKGFNYISMQNITRKNVKKYQNSHISSFVINKYITPERLNINNHITTRQIGPTIWIRVEMIIFYIDINGNMSTVPAWGLQYIWKNSDFRTTAFSFDILNQIMHAVTNNKDIFKSFTEYQITDVINILKKHNIIIDNLVPITRIELEPE